MLKGFSVFWIAGGLLIVILLGVGTFYLTNNFFKKPQSQLPQTTLPSPSPQTLDGVLQNINDTTSWRTYNNSKNGYSVKYPPVFEVRSVTEAGTDSVQFILPYQKESKIVINWQKKDKKMTLSDWVDSYMKNYENYKILERQNSTTPPPTSLSVISIDTSTTLFMFIEKDQENVINFSVANPLDDDSLRTIFNQMLTTFQFLDQSEE